MGHRPIYIYNYSITQGSPHSPTFSFIAAFLILRYKFKRIYAGRVDLPPKGQRMKPLPRGLLSIIPAILFADDEQIISKYPSRLSLFCF